MEGLNPDFDPSCGADIVDRKGVIGCVGREARNITLYRVYQIEGCLRVVSASMSQSLGDDHARSINTEMKLLPATPAVSSILGGGPVSFADDGEPCAVGAAKWINCSAAWAASKK